jgi:acetyl esterase
LEFLLESAGLGIDRDRVTIAGDSAGGNLAAVLALKLDQEGSPGKRRQVLLYPVTDMQGIDRESYHEKALENVMMRKLMLASRDLYLPSKEDRANPLASPLLAQFGRPQSDALILVAERDGLRSDGLDYGEALARAGTRVRCVLYRGAFHAFINNLGRSGVADDALEEIINFI